MLANESMHRTQNRGRGEGIRILPFLLSILRPSRASAAMKHRMFLDWCRDGPRRSGYRVIVDCVVEVLRLSHYAHRPMGF